MGEEKAFEEDRKKADKSKRQIKEGIRGQTNVKKGTCVIVWEGTTACHLIYINDFILYIYLYLPSIPNQIETA